MPSPALSQGQTVALVIAAAGIALLVLALALEGRSRRDAVRTRTRSALVGALLTTAGLALLLVRRLDSAALSGVLADLTAALVASAATKRTRPDASCYLGGLRERRIVDRRRAIPTSALRKELS
jgi:hypothetical protein